MVYSGKLSSEQCLYTYTSVEDSCFVNVANVIPTDQNE